MLADPSQVHQILMNLGTNAWHAMKDRPGVLEVTLDVVDADAAFVKTHVGLHTGHYVRLSVRDTGHGMAPAMQERIFEPFFTTKAPGEGTGLGLATVHGIMKSHAGEISVDSQPEGGTTFHLYFPALEVAVSDAELVPTPVPRGSGQRILFVDDEGGLVLWGTRALESLGYCVTGDQSVVHALAAVTDHPEAYDLVVTDLTMPVMTGIEFCRTRLGGPPGFAGHPDHRLQHADTGGGAAARDGRARVETQYDQDAWRSGPPRARSDGGVRSPLKFLQHRSNVRTLSLRLPRALAQTLAPALRKFFRSRL